MPCLERFGLLCIRQYNVVDVLAKGKKIEGLSGIVPDAVLNQKCYLIYVWGPNCGLCRNMTPMIDKLSQQRNDIAKIDVSQYPDTAKSIGVLGTPAIVLIENNIVQKVSLGVKTESDIMQLLE